MLGTTGLSRAEERFEIGGLGEALGSGRAALTVGTSLDQSIEARVRVGSERRLIRSRLMSLSVEAGRSTESWELCVGQSRIAVVAMERGEILVSSGRGMDEHARLQWLGPGLGGKSTCTEDLERVPIQGSNGTRLRDADMYSKFGYIYSIQRKDRFEYCLHVVKGTDS